MAQIIVGDLKNTFHQNESYTERGLHIVILDGNTGEPSFYSAFDTYKSSEKLEYFINEVKDGDIVIAACKDDCQNNLSEKCILWFESMGSKKIRKVKYRYGYVFSGIIGKIDSAFEKVSKNEEHQREITRIFRVPLENPVKKQKQVVEEVVEPEPEKKVNKN